MSIPAEMKALRITKESGTTKLIATTSPVPTIKDGEVLVKIAASYINPSDLMNSLGAFPFATFPRVPGRDFSGTVIKGPDNLVGKKVFGTSGNTISFTQDGAHAEYAAVPSDAVVEMPPNISFVQAATIGVPFSTAYLTVERAFTKPTDVVLVLGATGAVGDAVVQIAKARGCRVLTGARRDTADVNTKTDPQLARAKELTSGKGPDVIIDTVGDPVLMRAGLEVLGPNGRYSYISAPKAGSTEVTYDMRTLYRLGQMIIGSNSLLFSASETATVLRKLVPEFEQALLKPGEESQFTNIKLGEEAVEAYGKMLAKQPGKFVITM